MSGKCQPNDHTASIKSRLVRSLSEPWSQISRDLKTTLSSLLQHVWMAKSSCQSSIELGLFRLRKWWKLTKCDWVEPHQIKERVKINYQSSTYFGLLRLSECRLLQGDEWDYQLAAKSCQLLRRRSKIHESRESCKLLSPRCINTCDQKNLALKVRLSWPPQVRRMMVLVTSEITSRQPNPTSYWAGDEQVSALPRAQPSRNN